jgi:hypothetical protein
MAMRKFVPPIQGVSNFLALSDAEQLVSEFMNNVRPVDTLAKRLRISQRPGFDKWGAGVQIGGTDAPVVAICSVSTVK